MCLMTVSAMPLLSAVAAAGVTWGPLAYLAVVVSVFLYAPVLRTVRRRLMPPEPHGLMPATRVERLRRHLLPGWCWYLRLAVLGIVLSVPIAQVFFRGDLRSMAVPFIAAKESGQPQLVTGIPEPIYGASRGFPSYEVCQGFQGLVGTTLAEPCYSATGYLRLWQMSTALPTMICIALLYMGIPIVVAVCSPRSIARRAQHRAVGSSKGSI